MFPKEKSLIGKIYLICGEKNEGKTTRLRQLFSSMRNACGFAADKVFDGDSLIGYNLVNLCSGDAIPLARIHALSGECAAEGFINGPFRFSTAAFIWAREVFEDALRLKADAFFLDEVGRIELAAGGHSKLLYAALNSNVKIYMTVRNSNLRDVLRAFGIGEYTRIGIHQQPVPQS